MISIIIPNYNKGSFIRETLDSILHQTYEDWEVIIIDDGSTDNSIEICNEYIEKDKRFILIKRERLPKGGSTCRNIGIEFSKGDYIVFVDSDDVLAPQCLEYRINKIENSKFDFIVFQIGIFNTTINDSDLKWETQAGEHLVRFLKHDLPWHTMSCIWKKSFLKQINGFNESFLRLQDVEMHTRALMEENAIYDIVFNKKADCYYRIGNERIIADYELFVSNWMQGAESYLIFFEDFLEKKNKHSYIKYLRVTLLVVVSQLNYLYQNGNISYNSLLKHYNVLMNCDFSKNKLTAKHIILFKFYSLSCRIRLNRIKGFNYIFRRLIEVI